MLSSKKKSRVEILLEIIAVFIRTIVSSKVNK